MVLMRHTCAIHTTHLECIKAFFGNIADFYSSPICGQYSRLPLGQMWWTLSNLASLTVVRLNGNARNNIICKGTISESVISTNAKYFTNESHSTFSVTTVCQDIFPVLPRITGYLHTPKKTHFFKRTVCCYHTFRSITGTPVETAVRKVITHKPHRCIICTFWISAIKMCSGFLLHRLWRKYNVATAAVHRLFSKSDQRAFFSWSAFFVGFINRNPFAILCMRCTFSLSKRYKNVLRISLSQNAMKIQACSSCCAQTVFKLWSACLFCWLHQPECFCGFCHLQINFSLMQDSPCCLVPILQCILNDTQFEIFIVALSPRRQCHVEQE